MIKVDLEKLMNRFYVILETCLLVRTEIWPCSKVDDMMRRDKHEFFYSDIFFKSWYHNFWTGWVYEIFFRF